MSVHSVLHTVPFVHFGLETRLFPAASTEKCFSHHKKSSALLALYHLWLMASMAFCIESCARVQASRLATPPSNSQVAAAVVAAFARNANAVAPYDILTASQRPALPAMRLPGPCARALGRRIVTAPSCRQVRCVALSHVTLKFRVLSLAGNLLFEWAELH